MLFSSCPLLPPFLCLSILPPLLFLFSQSSFAYVPLWLPLGSWLLPLPLYTNIHTRTLTKNTQAQTYITPRGCLYCCFYELMGCWKWTVIEWVTMGGVSVHCVRVCVCLRYRVNWGLVGKCILTSVYSNANGSTETLYPAWNNKLLSLCNCT